jgi:hypothetical protein
MLLPQSIAGRCATKPELSITCLIDLADYSVSVELGVQREEEMARVVKGLDAVDHVQGRDFGPSYLRRVDQLDDLLD